MKQTFVKLLPLVPLCGERETAIEYGQSAARALVSKDYTAAVSFLKQDIHYCEMKLRAAGQPENPLFGDEGLD